MTTQKAAETRSQPREAVPASPLPADTVVPSASPLSASEAVAELSALIMPTALTLYPAAEDGWPPFVLDGPEWRRCLLLALGAGWRPAGCIELLSPQMISDPITGARSLHIPPGGLDAGARLAGAAAYAAQRRRIERNDALALAEALDRGDPYGHGRFVAAQLRGMANAHGVDVR